MTKRKKTSSWNEETFFSVVVAVSAGVTGHTQRVSILHGISEREIQDKRAKFADDS